MLIVGLGNPGEKYEGTRHNLGFRVADALRERWAFPAYTTRFDSGFVRGQHAGTPVMLMKPRTLMNLSGSAVLSAVTYYRIDPEEELWVVHDDLDLDLGRVRIKQQGGTGGHRGVADIMNRLDTDAFVRFKIGIGRPKDPRPIEKFVLEPFTEDERPVADKAVERCVYAVETALGDGVERAMTFFNA